jgi:hypothetical protein
MECGACGMDHPSTDHCTALDGPTNAGPFPTTPDHQQRFITALNELLTGDVDPFHESLEGYAAAAAAASMITDWTSSDDGTGYLTAAVKRSDVQDVIEILQKWAKTLTDTPATTEAK